MSAGHPLPWSRQLAMLTGRSLAVSARNPVVAINAGLAIFFILVYDGSLGGSPAVSSLVGGNFFDFIPSRRDPRRLDRRRRRRDLLRDGPAVELLLSSTDHAGLPSGADLRDDPRRGNPGPRPDGRRDRGRGPAGRRPSRQSRGAGGDLLLALLWGLGFAGYSVLVAILTRDPQITSAASVVFLPIIFLSPLLLPEEQLRPWVQVRLTVNPASYTLKAMRDLLASGLPSPCLVDASSATRGLGRNHLRWGDPGLAPPHSRVEAQVRARQDATDFFAVAQVARADRVAAATVLDPREVSHQHPQVDRGNLEGNRRPNADRQPDRHADPAGEQRVSQQAEDAAVDHRGCYVRGVLVDEECT